MAPGGGPAGSAAATQASPADGLHAWPAGASTAAAPAAEPDDSAYRLPVLQHGDPVTPSSLPWDGDGGGSGGAGDGGGSGGGSGGGDHSAVHQPDPGAGLFTPGQYTWNLVVGITASAVFVLVTAAALLGLIAFRRYMKRRNRTLSADTGVFSPRRGSKAGLDMIDNAVVLTSHRPLQRTGSIRKQFQKFLTR